MFREYAIEPAVFETWQTFRYLLDGLGPDQGRLVGTVPKQWLKRVRDAIIRGPEREVHKASMIERLRRLHPSTVLSRECADFDGNLPWLTSAQREHAREPFHAIIAKDGGEAAHILDPFTIDGTNPLWANAGGVLVARDAAAITEAIAPLLRVSRRLVWIDPYFRPNAAERLSVLNMVLTATRTNAAFEIHARLGADRDPGYTWAASECARVLPGLTPRDLALAVRFRAQRTSGPRLHNRYLLTDVGGLQFGDSPEQGAAGEEDRVSRLEIDTWQALWAQYTTSPSPFDDAGPTVTVIGIRMRR